MKTLWEASNATLLWQLRWKSFNYVLIASLNIESPAVSSIKNLNLIIYSFELLGSKKSKWRLHRLKGFRLWTNTYELKFELAKYWDKHNAGNWQVWSYGVFICSQSLKVCQLIFNSIRWQKKWVLLCRLSKISHSFKYPLHY